jgi:hypothetical protein
MANSNLPSIFNNGGSSGNNMGSSSFLNSGMVGTSAILGTNSSLHSTPLLTNPYSGFNSYVSPSSSSQSSSNIFTSLSSPNVFIPTGLSSFNTDQYNSTLSPYTRDMCNNSCDNKFGWDTLANPASLPFGSLAAEPYDLSKFREANAEHKDCTQKCDNFFKK